MRGPDRAARSVHGVARILTKDGWELVLREEDRTVARRPSERNDEAPDDEQRLEVRVTEHWFTVAISCFVARPKGGFGPCALKAIATLNQRMGMAKLGLDEDDALFVSVELPTEGFQESHSQAAVDAVLGFERDHLATILQAISVDQLNARMRM